MGTLAAALGCVAAVGAFHTPYRPEQSRHYDVTKTETFKPITEKVRLLGLSRPRGAAAPGKMGAARCAAPGAACRITVWRAAWAWACGVGLWW